MHVHSVPAEADISQVEQVPGAQTQMEGQDPPEQCHLAVLAHAICQEAEKACVRLWQPH